jgi:hypothetical protein
VTMCSYLPEIGLYILLPSLFRAGTTCTVGPMVAFLWLSVTVGTGPVRFDLDHPTSFRRSLFVYLGPMWNNNQPAHHEWARNKQYICELTDFHSHLFRVVTPVAGVA